MKILKQKSEFQEDEMQKLKKKIQEVSSLAAERSSKCTMAINAMKGITEQVNSSLCLLPSLYFPIIWIFIINCIDLITF